MLIEWQAFCPIPDYGLQVMAGDVKLTRVSEVLRSR